MNRLEEGGYILGLMGVVIVIAGVLWMLRWLLYGTRDSQHQRGVTPGLAAGGAQRRAIPWHPMMAWIIAGVVLSAQTAWAGALGIPLDGFLSTFQTFVVGLGLIMGLTGLVGYVGSLFDNPFSNILAGSIGFFTKAGILGGGTALMGFMGLVGGATL